MIIIMTVEKPENSDESSDNSSDNWFEVDGEESGVCRCCEQFLTKDFKGEILFGHSGAIYKYGDRCYVCSLLHQCKLCDEITKMSDYCEKCEKQGNRNREFFFMRDHIDRTISIMCYEGGERYEIKNDK